MDIKNGVFVVMLLAVLMMLWSCNCKVGAASQGGGDEDSLAIEREVMGYDSERVTQGSWMGLFLGMGQHRVLGSDGDSTFCYDCDLPELEGVGDVARQELEEMWYGKEYNETVKYRCTMGLYVDEEFPSQEIFRQVELGIDTLLTQSFCYNDELDNLKKSLSQRKGYAPRNTQDIMRRAKSIFDQFSMVYSKKPDTITMNLPESRICIVAHKIYDQGDWASYIIEFSFSYNGSNGCPSWADYITVNKKTGHRLTSGDLVEKYGLARVSASLRQAFVKAKCERNADLELYRLSGQELIDAADGSAIVNEGVMFYYRPYSVGSGAEGMFNLVLNLK